MRYGVNLLALVIGALILASLTFKGGRETLLICRNAMAEGAKNALPWASPAPSWASSSAR
jgi:hypothetical protein